MCAPERVNSGRTAGSRLDSESCPDDVNAHEVCVSCAFRVHLPTHVVARYRTASSGYISRAVNRDSELHLKATRLHELHARHAREHGNEEMARVAEDRAERARQRFARSLAKEHEAMVRAYTPARRSAPGERGGRVAGFLFRLVTTDGGAAEPPVLRSSVPNWSSGDAIPLGAGRTLRVVEVRDDDADKPPVLVVEDMAS